MSRSTASHPKLQQRLEVEEKQVKESDEAWYMRLSQMMTLPVSFPDGPVFRNKLTEGERTKSAGP